MATSNLQENEHMANRSQDENQHQIPQQNLQDRQNSPQPNLNAPHQHNENTTRRNVNNNVNNNNVVRNNLVSMRERLFQALFFRMSLVYARNFPPPIRRFLEFVILFKAIMMLSLLVYIHFAFIKTPITCLDDYVNNWPKDGVLRVEILKNAENGYSLNDSYHKEERLHHKHLAIMNAYSSYVNLMLEEAAPSIIFNDEVQDEQEMKDSNVTLESPPPQQTFLESLEDSDFTWNDDDYILEYSLEHGFLRLSLNARMRLNISVKLAVLDPNNHTCFGGRISKFVLDEFLGYDDLLLSSLKYLAEKEQQKNGYVRNVVTGEHYRFVNFLPYSGSLLYAFFVMVIFTLSVSMLLRYSHHHIFMFIIHLLQMVEMNIAVSFPAAPLLTVVLALVGMEAIMSEFFKDNSIAFYVIVLIWLCDQYDAICCHTYITKKYWLRFFYLYHFAFFAHHHKFNGQYSGIALMTFWLFIFHSMLYFFHHYELPALQQAQVVGHIRTLVLRNIQNEDPAGINRTAPAAQNATAGGAAQPNVNSSAHNATQTSNLNPPGNNNPNQPGSPQVINFILRYTQLGNNNQVQRGERPVSLSLRGLWNAVQNARGNQQNGVRFRFTNTANDSNSSNGIQNNASAENT